MFRSGFPFFLVAVYLAILSLTSCSNREHRAAMLAVLDEADSLNRNDIPLTNDSALQDAVAYFDSHGTANDRMRAYSLLGRTYDDCGEKLKALDAFHNAASAADTTASDCDYHTLSRVHAQMSMLFEQQYLPYQMLDANKLWNKYSLRAKDTLSWIISSEKLCDYYMMTGKKDSAIIYSEYVYNQYLTFGYTVEAANSIDLLPLLLAEKGLVDKACYYQNLFESNSSLYDRKHGTPTHLFYYYVKGRCYLSSSKVDSALTCFRTLLNITNSTHDKEVAYKGLYMAYSSICKYDSAAKYADLCYRQSESNFLLASSKEFSRMQAFYDYSSYQQLANNKEREAFGMRQRLIVLLSVGIVIVLFLLLIIYTVIIKKKQHIAELTARYEVKISQLEEVKRELENPAIESSREEKLKMFQNRQVELLNLLGIENDSMKHVDLLHNEVYDCFKRISINPKDKAKKKDWDNLQCLFDRGIPDFFRKITHGRSITEADKRLCMLIRMQFCVSEICNIMDVYSQYVSTRRRQLLMKYFKIKGKPEEFDQILMMIN